MTNFCQIWHVTNIFCPEVPVGEDGKEEMELSMRGQVSAVDVFCNRGTRFKSAGLETGCCGAGLLEAGNPVQCRDGRGGRKLIPEIPDSMYLS